MASEKHNTWFLPSSLDMETKDILHRQSEDLHVHKGTYLGKADC